MSAQTTRLIVTVTHPPTQSAEQVRQWIESVLHQASGYKIDPPVIDVKLQ